MFTPQNLVIQSCAPVSVAVAFCYPDSKRVLDKTWIQLVWSGIKSRLQGESQWHGNSFMFLHSLMTERQSTKLKLAVAIIFKLVSLFMSLCMYSLFASDCAVGDTTCTLYDTMVLFLGKMSCF